MQSRLANTVLVLAIALAIILMTYHWPDLPEPRTADPQSQVASQKDPEGNLGKVMAAESSQVPAQRSAVASTPLLLGGLLRELDSAPLPKLKLGVHGPYWPAVRDAKGAYREMEVDASGQFLIELPRAHYEHMATVLVWRSIEQGESNHDALVYSETVPIRTGMDITLPDLSDVEPLTGMIALTGPTSADKFDVRLVTASRTDAQPSFQTSISGPNLQVALPSFNLLRKTVGPVAVLVHSSSRDNYAVGAMNFVSIDALSDALSGGQLRLDISERHVHTPALDGDPAERMHISPVDTRWLGSFEVKVSSGIAKALLAAGDYWVKAFSDRVGKFALARITVDPAATSVLCNWMFVAPGDYSYRIHVEDEEGRPLPDVAAYANQTWHEVESKTRADGVLDLPGLFAGAYDLSLSRPGYVSQKFRIEVPGDLARCRLPRASLVTIEIRQPSGSLSLERHRQIMHRSLGMSWAGSDGRDPRLVEVLPGAHEFLVLGERTWGYAKAEVPRDGTTVVIALQPYCEVTGEIDGVGAGCAIALHDKKLDLQLPQRLLKVRGSQFTALLPGEAHAGVLLASVGGREPREVGSVFNGCKLKVPQ